MRAAKRFRSIIFVLVGSLVFSIGAHAQDGKTPNQPEKFVKVNKASDSQNVKRNVSNERISQDDNLNSDEKKEAKEASAYYTNYLEEYRLGPTDIISVEVFGQCPDYCRTDLTVPPTARISYPLIREGVFVGGKTTVQIQDEITKILDEFIIDPKVTVTLRRAGSAHYAVMGKVVTPGVRIMNRKISINEAIISAGGLAKGANKKKVFIARFNPQGFYEKRQVDLIAIERGKIPTVFLRPGDQVFVGEKGFTWSKVLGVLERVSASRILFGSPF